MTYDVIVIGGGLAGCSAATRLAQAGRRVLLLEKQRYPAHKLCGEFLSVEVQAMFERLGVHEAVASAGAQPITNLRVTTAGRAVFESALPGTALGLSRYTLDRLLFERARRAGAEAHDGTAVRNVIGSLDEGFVVEADGQAVAARLVLGAYGKRSVLDRKLDRPFLRGNSPLVAFKAHYEGIELPGWIELHAFPDGYCGLSPIEDGRINVCWIAHERALKAAAGDPETMIEQSLLQNPALAERFRSMRRVTEPFLAVSQIVLSPKGAFAGDVCMIGDTVGMIAPMCGDGMAMALRSAEQAVPLAVSFLDETLDATGFRDAYERAWRSEFGVRMRLGRWMHHGYSRPTLATAGVRLCQMMPGLGRRLIRATRG